MGMSRPLVSLRLGTWGAVVGVLLLVAVACIPPQPTGHVATVTVDGQLVTVAGPEGSTVTVASSDGSGLPATPAGLVFPVGALDITVAGIAAGSVVEVTVTLDEAVESVRKLIGGAWDPFTPDGTSGATVSPDGLTITLLLQDGGRGDTDGSADGTITDPLAPAIAVADADISTQVFTAEVAGSAGSPVVAETPDCAAGTVVVGGGFALSGGTGSTPEGVLIQASLPSGDHWRAVAIEPVPTGQGWSLGAYVVCAWVDNPDVELESFYVSGPPFFTGNQVSIANAGLCGFEENGAGSVITGGGFDLGEYYPGARIEDSVLYQLYEWRATVLIPGPGDFYAWAVCTRPVVTSTALTAPRLPVLDVHQTQSLSDSPSDSGQVPDTADALTACDSGSPLGGGFDMGRGTESNIPAGVNIDGSFPTVDGWRSVAREAPAQAEQWYVRSWQVCGELSEITYPIDGPPLQEGQCYQHWDGTGPDILVVGPIDSLGNIQAFYASEDGTCSGAPFLPSFTVVSAPSEAAATSKCQALGTGNMGVAVVGRDYDAMPLATWECRIF